MMLTAFGGVSIDTFKNTTTGEETLGRSSYCPGPIVWSVTPPLHGRQVSSRH
jgi:hypothetical protein